MDLKDNNFAINLHQALQNSKWTDTITDYNKSLKQKPLKSAATIPLTYFPLEHQLMHMEEYSQFIYYFFTSEKKTQLGVNQRARPQFTLNVFCFQKYDGSHHKTQLRGLKGQPSCITSGMAAYITISQKKVVLENHYDYKMMIIIGTRQGFVKLVELTEDKSKKKLKIDVISHKIEQKTIVAIKVMDKTHYNQKNIAFIMFQDCKVFIFNFVSLQVVAVYQPRILCHDRAVSLTVHCSGKYLATASHTGQLIFWEVNQKALEAIDKSEDRRMRVSEDRGKQVREEVWGFRLKDRVICVYPMSTLHSASVSGLKWVQFMGNLLALVTNDGIFRLIGVNYSIKDEYICLIDYPIGDGEAISSVQLFPESQTIAIFKSHRYMGLTESNGTKNEPSLEDLAFKGQLMSSQDPHLRFNCNNFHMKQSQGSCMEMLRFHGDLRITEAKNYMFITDGKSESIQFEGGLLVRGRSVVMCRNNKGFFIGQIENPLGE